MRTIYSASGGNILWLGSLPFREVWAVDFEFSAQVGEVPDPVCVVARELKSGRTIRQWRDQFGAGAPYPTDESALFVAYYASAELGCHLALGWAMPLRVLDLFAEFRNRTNGLETIAGSGLIGALAHFGLDGIGGAEKDEMRNLVLRGGPWSGDEQAAITQYCESDVDALARLLAVMLPTIDLPRALLRGRYMAAAARMERNGVPIDTATLALLLRHVMLAADVNHVGKIDQAHLPPHGENPLAPIVVIQWVGGHGF